MKTLKQIANEVTRIAVLILLLRCRDRYWYQVRDRRIVFWQ
jgi:hypothetical protein